MARQSQSLSIRKETEDICLEPVYCVPICFESGLNRPQRHPNIFTILELRLSSNGDLNLDTGVDVDNDLLDNLGRGVEAA